MQIRGWESVVLVIWILFMDLKWKQSIIHSCLLDLKVFVRSYLHPQNHVFLEDS